MSESGKKKNKKKGGGGGGPGGKLGGEGGQGGKQGGEGGRGGGQGGKQGGEGGRGGGRGGGHGGERGRGGGQGGGGGRGGQHGRSDFPAFGGGDGGGRGGGGDFPGLGPAQSDFPPVRGSGPPGRIVAPRPQFHGNPRAAFPTTGPPMFTARGGPVQQNIPPPAPWGKKEQMGPPQMGPPQMGPPQMGPPQMGPPQMGPPQMGPPQMGPPQMGPPQQQQKQQGGGGGMRKQEKSPHQPAQMPAPIAESHQAPGPDRSKPAEPAKATPALDVELLRIPLRRQAADRSSKAGRRIKLDVNHMALSLTNYNIVAYHYDVVFEPEKPKFLLRPAINEFFKMKFPGREPNFDGVKNLYSNGPLVPNDRGLSAEVSVFNEESQNMKNFKITICVVNKIDMMDLQHYQKNSKINPQMALTVLDVALRSFCCSRLVSSGRKFFSPPQGRVIELGDGLELWHGHFQAASLGWKPYLNLDISHKGFYECLTIAEAIQKICGGSVDRELDDNQKRSLTNHLKGIKVDYEVPGMPSSKRSYRVNGVVNSPKREKFKDDDNKEWTIEDYYAAKKKYRLKYPSMPCLWVGSKEKTVRIPGELCRISPGQAFNRKYNETQTAAMVRSATSDTDRRRENIMNAFRSTGLSQNNPYIKEFGISVSGQFERVEGRLLDAPRLEYGNNQTINPSKGTWRAAKFLVPMKVTDWAILGLNFRTREDELRKLGDMISRQSKDVGMDIGRVSDIQMADSRNRRKIEEALLSMKGKQIVFVCVPDSGDTYAVVKKIAEMNVGVLTQCIKARTLFKLNPATVGNILLKVNAKLNGVNHSFAREGRPACLNRPVMIVGADVTHPAPGQDTVPSIAAVAASYDAKAFKYNMIWKMQPKGEMIVDLENIMKDQLMHFYRSTKHKPEKILFYRDGVSDGEIQKVMSREIAAIRRACIVLEGDYQPKITFVVVQKRHHTRFFPADKRDIYDTKNFNLPAGTVVDTDIVHPHETEFLLLSHASILGTARPTKYRLVWDDSDFYENDLEQLSYYLCHMFTRCTRSVSYPAPTYYAHLAAFRARSYLEAERLHSLNNLPEEQRKRKMHEGLMLNSPMFFV